MSNERISFYYDPQRQGYDTTLWKTVAGVPAINGTVLRFTSATAIHYGDILKGEISFNLKVPTSPDIGHAREFGFKQLATGACVTFKVVDDVLNAVTSDGTNTDTIELEWNPDWNATSTIFKIVWLGFEASFYINDVRVALMRADYSYTPTVAPIETVPKGPLSIYIANGNADNMDLVVLNADDLINYI